MLSKLHAEKYLTCQPTLSMKLKLIMWKQTQADSSESRASHCNYSSIAAVCPNSQSWGKTDCATVASSPVDNIIPPSPIPPMAVACLRKVHIIWDFWDFGENECKLLLLKKKKQQHFFLLLQGWSTISETFHLSRTWISLGLCSFCLYVVKRTLLILISTTECACIHPHLCPMHPWTKCLRSQWDIILNKCTHTASVLGAIL